MSGLSNRRRLPVRVILLFVAVVLVLPGLFFGGILLDQFAESERADNRAELLSTAARIADAVDRELGGLVMAARVLAISDRVAGADLAAFASESRAASSVLGHPVFLVSTDGTRLMTAGAEDDADLASGADADIQRVVSGRRPVISNLLGREKRHMHTVVLAPVFRGEEIVAVIGVAAAPNFFVDLLRDQSLGEGWVATLRDRDGALLARTEETERFLGMPSSAPIAPSQVAAIETLDGIPAMAASAPVRASGWRVSVAVLREVVEAPIRKSERWLALTGAGAMALGIVLAWQLATRISGPLSALAQAGRDLGAGRDVAPVRSAISEVQDVSAALIGAHDQLLDRSSSLAAERARLAAIIETVPVGLLIADASGSTVAGNRQLARMLPVASADGAPKSATRPATQASLVAIDEQGQSVPDHSMPLRRALAGEDPAELRCRFRRVDGSLFWAQAVAAPVAGANGQVIGAVLALLDIDDTVRARQQKERWADQLGAEVKARTSELEQINRKLRDEVTARGRAEDQLRQAQKMEAVGRLTGGIAHDFNNLLTVILGSLELLRRRVSEPSAIRFLDSATDGANRAAELIGQLLAFSRRQPLNPQPLDVNRLVIGMSSLMRRSLGETITIETVLQDDLCQAFADPNQLESALLNLAVNARDAMLDTATGGGLLRIQTSAVTLKAAEARDGGLRPGEYVVIAVINSGGGMSPETVAQAFEPFFTTKPHGKGTGLGLSQVHGFAVQSGGHVTIDSQLGKGTAVSLFLPRTPADTVPRPGSAVRPVTQVARVPGIVVLVVEDEPAVLLFAAEALRLLGYVVLEASSGERALEILALHPEIGLMLTDVVMPGMNGRQLARAVERRRPDLPILLASGYSRAPEEKEDTRWELLPKPFSVTDLAGAIDRTLRKQRNRIAARDPAALHDLGMNA